MQIGILGSGGVARTLGSKLVAIGHDVRLGSRDAANEKAVAWAGSAAPRGSNGTFADAAGFGEVLMNCTSGMHSLAALELAGAASMSGKILMDVANPLDFSRGMPPTFTVSNTDSLGEQIQRAYPDVKVVKTLNTVNARLMVEPALVPGEHDLFVCGNDAAAKDAVKGYMRDWFGWRTVIDAGDITAARGLEAWLALWVRLMMELGTPLFNIHIQR